MKNTRVTFQSTRLQDEDIQHVVDTTYIESIHVTALSSHHDVQVQVANKITDTHLTQRTNELTHAYLRPRLQSYENLKWETVKLAIIFQLSNGDRVPKKLCWSESESSRVIAEFGSPQSKDQSKQIGRTSPPCK